MVRCLVLWLLAAAAAGCRPGAVPPEAVEAATGTVVILHTNDTHGQIWGGEGSGSAAQRATLIDGVRREVRRSGVVVVLDAGDVRTGSYCSDRRQAVPDFEAMAAMGYDAMTLGNHEFDVPFDAASARSSDLGFELLGANVVDPRTGEPAVTPYTVIERGGARVGVLGLVTPETPTTSTLGSEAGLRFDDPVAVCRRYMPELEDRADVLVVLSHLGLHEDRDLARDCRGIDVIVGGHSHHALERPEQIRETIIAHAGSDGRFLGRLDLEVSSAGVQLLEGRLLPVTADLPAREEVAEILDRYSCPEVHEVVARASESITRAPLAGPGSSSALANLVGAAFCEAAGADVALLNRGGLRADIPAGVVTFGRVHAVLPFANHLVVLEATGADLLAAAQGMAGRGPRGRGVLLPTGMEWIIGSEGSVTVTVAGGPVDLERRYRLVVSSFIAGGGDRHPSIVDLRRLEALDVTPRAALEAHLRRVNVVEPDRTVHLRWEPRSRTSSARSPLSTRPPLSTPARVMD